MNIVDVEVDYYPSPENTFFISVSVGDKEAISFDYTVKGHRIIKQVLVGRKPFPKNKAISGEWDAVVLKDRKFVRKYPVKWINMGKKDWCNDEIWETVWEKPVSKELKEKLVYFSHLVSDNYQNLNKFSKELSEFENFLSKEIAKYV